MWGPASPMAVRWRGLVWAKVFFNEPLTKQKFAGLGLILLGVFFVGMGS